MKKVLIILGIVDIAMIASVVWIALLIPASGAFIPGLIFLDISILFGAIFLFCLLFVMFLKKIGYLQGSMKTF